jgi:DNA-directed RNA polymerase specialized sigma24 family protein
MAYGAALNEGRERKREPVEADPVREMWDRLIREHDRKVVLSLLAIGVERDRARELAQQTWTRLLEQYRAGKLESLEFPGLAIRQARFLAIDSFRKSDLHRRTLAVNPDDGAIDGEHQLLTRDQLRRALAALATCSKQAQQLFKLMYADQPPRSCVEAARELGLSTERARHIVCETRKVIRLAVAGDGETS